MSIIKNILGSFFGTKSGRDLKALKPIIDKVQKVSPTIESLSDDGLRAKLLSFKIRLIKQFPNKI